MINLIPLPLKYKNENNFFEFNELTLKSDFELELVDLKRNDNANLIISKDESIENEGYHLEINDDKIIINASTKIGAYYGIQSLRQLSRFEFGNKKIQCCVIDDKPQFEWRGLELDESRHFFGKDEVKRILDIMFMMKLNVFHWHLTDDNGWRIQIDKYPLLTDIGSKREYTQINGWHSTDLVYEKYEHFYTKEDIKEVIEYAKERGIMVVPEIDFPAHCASAIAAYPWLACRELKREVPGYFGSRVPVQKFKQLDYNRPICVGKEKTMQFVFDVIDEVCELFDAPYYHIGGDECPKNEWNKCPNCQKMIKDNKLKDSEDLQGYFNNQIQKYLEKKSKQLIGWNEILKAKSLSKTIIPQYWTPKRDKRAEDHINNGGKMIMSNHQSFYFDMTYGQYPLTNTYNYNPKSFGVKDSNIENILGVEGEVWTEWISDEKKLDLNIFPRMQALSEVAWTPQENRNFNDFKNRLDNFKKYYKLFNVNYAVDKVSLPTNKFNRLKIQKLFNKGDTDYEVTLNDDYKNQGER